MTSPKAAYTPLESLLLFQALRSQHSTPDALFFNRVASELKSIPLVHNDPSYDSGRLSADALRDLYLSLVKEEAKRDLERQLEKENSVPNGDESRKRKAPSPTLPTVLEATHHAHLIPQLVARLYATYREKAVTEIRDYERTYDDLQRDIQEIEAGKGDEQLEEPHAVQSPKPSSSAHTQPAATASPAPSVPLVQSGAAPASSTPPPRPAEANTQAPPKPYSHAKIDAVINHGPEPQHASEGHRRTSSNTALPPLSEMAPQSPRFGIPPAIAGSVPHVQQRQYSHSPPATHQSPYAPHHTHPVPGTPVQNNLSRPSSRHELSPRPILPPPPGMQLPPPTPPQHVPSPNMRGPPMPPHQHPQAHHMASIGTSPVHDRPPLGYTPQLPPPPPQSYYQQPQYPDRRTSYPPSHGQPVQGYLAQTPQRPLPGGYPLQPFMVDAAQSGKQAQIQHTSPQQQQPPRPQAPAAQTPRPLMYGQHQTVPATVPVQTARANSPLMSNILAALATPTRAPSRPLWKSDHRPPPVPLPSEPPRPEVEPLSPKMERNRPVRTTRSRATPPPPPEEPSGREPVQRATKARKRQTRAGTPGSVASSTIARSTRGRTRSQSVSTVAGTNNASDDRPGSRGNIKAEPSTPADVLDQPEHIREPSATPAASGPVTRKRRGTLQPHPQPISKRKRHGSPLVTVEIPREVAGTPPARPTTVVATRNFAKVASAIMNDITSHKHASYFTSPVRDKDASGYSEIIKRPQHLKSIRAAIVAGSRAIAAATSSVDSPSATPTASSARFPTDVELEQTADLVPPKAIVNGAQLEKEVYRMFANAVMFNPGEDGLVADTREMFDDVEAKMKEWRSAERDSGPTAEEEDDGRGKRRKL